MFFASFSLSLSFFFACSSWPSLRPFTRLDYDGGRGQVLNRIPFAVMRARREHFRKEAVQPTMCFVHHRATMQFQCRSGRNCRNYSPCLNVLFYAMMLRKRHQCQVNISLEETEQSRFFWEKFSQRKFHGFMDLV